MALTQQDISRIANLAQLELSPERRKNIQEQLNQFFALVEKMQSVDTRGIEPLAHPLAAIQPMALRLHKDAVSETEQRERYQQNAPATESGFFLVPKVIE